MAVGKYWMAFWFCYKLLDGVELVIGFPMNVELYEPFV